MAKKLVDIAASDSDSAYMYNLRVNGNLKHVHENANMWSLLTTVSFTPILEFDFVGGWG